MTKDFTENRDRFYGGEIDVEDFNTYEPNKRRINKYAKADELYNTLLANKKRQEEMRIYKRMTLQELKQIGKISASDGKPSDTLTDSKWQEEFEIRKLFVKPATQKRLCGNYTRIYDICEMTSYQAYRRYINDILSSIRSGCRDYCYYIYQIMELARFHQNLKTRYIPEYKCWEVWL